MNQVRFGTIESFDDLELFLHDVTVEPPQAKRTLVEVPGRDGELDLSYGISSDMHFNNRKIKLDFTMQDYQFQWQQKFADIMNALHGRSFKVWIEPDDTRYWQAFCTVNSMKSDRNKGMVVVELDAEPYQYIDYSRTVVATVSGTDVEIEITRKTEVPTITSAQNIVITKDEVNYAFDAGTHKNPDLRLTQGNNVLIVTGTGQVVISYKDGSL